MSDEDKLNYFDTNGTELINAVNSKWLKKHLKQHRLLSPTDRWTDAAVIGLVDRWLRVEGGYGTK